MERTNNHSDILYHYTGKGGLEALLEILKNGFKFGYCEEFLPRNRFVAFPMLCFCDIPIELSKEHRGKYGEFGIGVSKKYMVEHFKDWFGPVNYVISNSAIEAAFTVRDLIEEKKQHANDIIENRGIKNGKYVSINGEDGMDYIIDINDSIAYHMKAIASIALMKPYSSDEGVINYDECEWRMFIPENGIYRGEKEKCKWFWEKRDFTRIKNSKGEVIANGNKKLYFDGFKLKLPLKAIERIVVPTKEDSEMLKSEIKSFYHFMEENLTSDNIKYILDKIIIYK